jgi:hypothetical protein
MESGLAKKHSGFQMPKAVTITGRSSSLTAAFVSAIIPTIFPSAAEVDEALTVLGMTAADIRCAYCGDPYTEWDHLRSLVIDQKPTGYISELANLVPSCGKCNQSKGKHPWRVWMRSKAPRCPGVRGVADLEIRIERLEAYERWRQPQRLDFQILVGEDLWNQHWKNWRDTLDQLRTSQSCAERLRAAIANRGEIT